MLHSQPLSSGTGVTSARAGSANVPREVHATTSASGNLTACREWVISSSSGQD